MLVGNARSGVMNKATLTYAWRKREAAAPVSRTVDLPAADEGIQDAVSIAGELLPFAKRKFVYGIENPDVIAIHVIRTVTRARRDSVEEIADTDCVVGTKVIGVGPGVVRHQLQTMREPLVHFDLQCVVV